MFKVYVEENGQRIFANSFVNEKVAVLYSLGIEDYAFKKYAKEIKTEIVKV